MKKKIYRYISLLGIFFCLLGIKVNGQSGLCPSNLDLEMGNFTNWVCRGGTVGIIGGLNTVTWTSTGPPVSSLHRIITAPGGVDPYGGFPELCPNGSGYSARIGNESASLTGGVGREASGVSYIYSIPASATVFSIFFNYAVVLENPNHTPEQQPRFRAKIKDLTSGTTIPCVDFDFTASSSLPGFLPSPLSPWVLYKNWTPVTLNLSGLAGRTIELEFIVTECTQLGHFAYAYVDVNSNCNGAIAGSTICLGNNQITLTAPFGFQSYDWYADNTFSTVLSTTHNLTLTPAPLVGSVFPVVVVPFPGFGCRDTLYATISVAQKPNSIAGPDTVFCINKPQQIGTSPTTGLQYSWTPAAQVSSPIIANPIASVTSATPVEFIVKTTDILTGCFSFDTAYISGRQADTTLIQKGKTVYCETDTAGTVLEVKNTLSSVQWYNGGTPIVGATSFIFKPSVSGSYWARVQQIGCIDSTRKVNVTINPVPISIAGNDATICINETLQIGSINNPSYLYSWTPSNQLSNMSISNPIIWVTSTMPQEFIVHTTDTTTGCNSYDTTIITGLVMDTALTITGKTEYCEGDLQKGSLAVNNTLSAIQWYNGSTALPGATGYTYLPTVSGGYWATLQNAGCTDSTRTVQFNIHAVPIADFKLSNDSSCINNNSFSFTNLSNAPDGASLTYLWKMSDGSVQTVTDALKSFSSPGTYSVQLIVTSQFGCTNSTADSFVYVLPNTKPDFTWDSVCIDRPVQFKNLSAENGSVQVEYNWNFNNGLFGYAVKNPPPITFTSEGTIDVVLWQKSFGCENFPDSVIKKVQVNKPKEGVRYKDLTVAEGSSQYIKAREGVGKIFNWLPQTQLSRYNNQYTQFIANGNDVLYKITITDLHTCNTIDTMLVQILRKPGYYLPTAFTPNGDGLNDLAIPYLVGMKSLKSFTIFNRWGNLLFATSTYQHGWDGSYKGEPQPNGTYVWMLEYVDNSNQLIKEKGTITIVR